MADDEMKRLLDGLTAPSSAPGAMPPSWEQEERFRRRALQLQTAAEVAAAASSILEPNRLLSQVVELIRDRFSLYYVGIFLLQDPPDAGDERYAVLVAATGRTGQQMVEAGHKLRVGGDSMIGRCIARGRARIALDVGREADRFDNPSLPETRSEMALPLISRGQVIGAMTIQSAQPAAFAQDDITALQTMANQLATAIENARLFEERERRITELSIVNEIGQAMSATLTMDALLEIVHLQVSRLFDTTNFYIAAYEEGSEEWASIFHIERGEQQPLARYSIEAGVTGYIIRHRRPLLFRSQAEIIAFLEAQGTEALGEMARSWLGVPLIVAERLVGVMAIQNYERDNLYDEEDLALFSTIAAQVATALDNARLFQERERRIAELAILDQIRQAISQQLGLEQVLETVYEQVRQIMPADAFFLALYDAQRGHITYPLVYDQGRRYEMEPEPLSPQGYLIRVLESGQPYLSNLTAEEMASIQLTPAQAVGDVDKISASLLFVPLRSGQQTIGVLSAQSYRLNAYDESHITLLQSIADQTAIAIERARLFEEVRSRAEDLALLNEIGQTIASVLDPDALLRRIVDTIKERFGHYFVGILLIEGEELVFRSGSMVGDSDVRWERGNLRLALDGYGLNVVAAASGQPVLVNDVNSDDRYGTVEGLEPVQAELDVPITVKGRVIGTLTVQSDRPNAFDQSDVALMQSLANQAGIAIENARLFEQTQIALAESEALYQATQAVSEPLEMEPLIERLVEAACHLAQARYGIVLTLDPESGKIAHFKTYGVNLASFPAHHLPKGEGLLGTVLSGQVVRTDDVPGRASALKVSKEHLPVQAILGVPLLYGGQVQGLVMVGEPPGQRTFSERDERVLTSFATQAAIALENRRLLERAQARAAWESRLRAIADRIHRGVDIEAVLRVGTEELSRVLGASQVIVHLGSREQLLTRQPAPWPGTGSVPQTGAKPQPPSGPEQRER